MDTWEYSTLMDFIGDVPDPRHARGQRHRWRVLLTLIAAALICGQRTGRAIGQWVDEHTVELMRQPWVPHRPLPRPSTLRRALQALDVTALEAQLAAFSAYVATRTPPLTIAGPWQGQAVDGKAVRGANGHGAQVHLVSLVQHETGIVRAQVRVREKSNEITAVPSLLTGHDLAGTVTTMDALLCQRAIAQQILDQQGHYLMVVKDNQPALLAAIALVFQRPPLPQPTDYRQTDLTVEKGHGRLATRTVERTAALNGYVDWPGVGQVVRRTCERIRLSTGEVSREVTYGVTSVPAADSTAAQVAALWRSHWGIENKVHYVRDVTMGEDAGQAYIGQTPHVLAALRNGLITLLRSKGVTQVADALRHHGASVQAALALLNSPL